MANVVWTNAVGVSVTGNTITKTGAGGAWDAGASSSQSIASGDCYITAVAGDTSHSVMIGLSHGDPDQGYTGLKFAFYLTGNGSGTLQIYESGSYVGDFGTFAPGDVLKIAVESGQIKYYNGASLKRTVASPTLTYPLIMDTSINTNGGAVNSAVIYPTAGGLLKMAAEGGANQFSGGATV